MVTVVKVLVLMVPLVTDPGSAVGAPGADSLLVLMVLLLVSLVVLLVQVVVTLQIMLALVPLDVNSYS